MSKMEILPKDYGIETEKANELTKGLQVVKSEREVLINEFNEVSKLELITDNIPKFKELRLKIVKNRTQGINKWHKANKEFFLTGGKFVDAIKNKEILINEQMEEKLMSAEKHFENLEKERIEKLQLQRVNLLKEFVEDASERDLAIMDEDVWESYLQIKKQTYLDKLQDELDAEKQRQAKIEADKKEHERIRKENEKLKKEAEERDRLAKIEAEKKNKRSKELKPYLIFIRDYNQLISKPEKEYIKEFVDIKKGAEDHWEFERKEQLKIQKEQEQLEAKRKKQLAEEQAKLKKERELKLKLEKELKQKKEAELKHQEYEKARIEKELNKGDSDKVKDLISELELLKSKYSFKSSKNKKMYNDVGLLIDKVVSHINS